MMAKEKKRWMTIDIAPHFHTKPSKPISRPCTNPTPRDLSKCYQCPAPDGAVQALMHLRLKGAGTDPLPIFTVALTRSSFSLVLRIITPSDLMVGS